MKKNNTLALMALLMAGISHTAHMVASCPSDSTKPLPGTSASHLACAPLLGGCPLGSTIRRYQCVADPKQIRCENSACPHGYACGNIGDGRYCTEIKD